MTGRRLRSDEETARELFDLLALYRSIPHPPQVSEKIFSALCIHADLPPSMRDETQMRDDIANALALSMDDVSVLDPIFPHVFWFALARVSAREHIVLQPGQMRKSGPLQ